MYKKYFKKNLNVIKINQKKSYNADVVKFARLIKSSSNECLNTKQTQKRNYFAVFSKSSDKFTQEVSRSIKFGLKLHETFLWNICKEPANELQSALHHNLPFNLLIISTYMMKKLLKEK